MYKKIRYFFIRYMRKTMQALLTEKGTFAHISGVLINSKSFQNLQIFLAAWKAIRNFREFPWKLRMLQENQRKFLLIIRYFLISIWKSVMFWHSSSKLMLTIPPARYHHQQFHTLSAKHKKIFKKFSLKIWLNFQNIFEILEKFPTSTHIFNLWKCTKNSLRFLEIHMQNEGRDLKTNISGEISFPRSVPVTCVVSSFLFFQSFANSKT